MAKKKTKKKTKKKENPLRWVAEPLMDDSSYIEKPMFGALACYYRGKLALVLAAKKEPWAGVLFPTDRQFHESIQKEFPQLGPHCILGKWLYLPENTEDFEAVVGQVIDRISRRDKRFGVEPKQR